jgi:DNA-binding NarL/FixJ family response regulator
MHKHVDAYTKRAYTAIRFKGERMMKVKVYLYSNEPVLFKGLESVLRQEREFNLLPACGAAAGMTTETPDLVLIDLTPEVTFGILSEIKHALMGAKVILWVNTISNELAFQAISLGVKGILRKTLSTDLQVECLKKVAEGGLWFEKTLTDSFLSARRVALTQREGQLVSLLTQGLKNKEIGQKLTITEGTVKVYLSRLFNKTGVKDRFELALYGIKNLGNGQSSGGAFIPGLRSLILEPTLWETAPVNERLVNERLF